VYPKQYYEAWKQFEKFKAKQGKNNTEEQEDLVKVKKAEILKRRMEVERESNEKRIGSLHG
jgi:hypothetical protein